MSKFKNRLGKGLTWMPLKARNFPVTWIFTLLSGGGYEFNCLHVQKSSLKLAEKPEAILTFHSNAPTAIPAAAPVPASPTKCPLPILLLNKDAPTGNQVMFLPAKKNPLTFPRFVRHIAYK